MGRFGAFGEAYRDRVREFIGSNRTVIAVVEYEEAELPADIVRSDGTLDLYDDVQARFEIAYRRRTRKLSIRAGGWVGYVPINDRYTLSVEPRVPVSNLERVMAQSRDVRIDILNNYSRAYGDTDERPQGLYDIVADQFLEAVDRIWRDGLLKGYRQEARTGAMPFGRIDPYGTELLMKRTKRPLAVFSAFSLGPRIVGRIACVSSDWVEKGNLGRRRWRAATRDGYGFLTDARVGRWYERIESRGRHSRRGQRLREACRRLEVVASLGGEGEFGQAAVEKVIERLPVRHVAYVDALRLAGLIVRDWGIRVTGAGGVIVLPVVLVDMADVFEKYARRVLRREAARRGGVQVKDGNILPPEGARRKLFGRYEIGGQNPGATPDIVVEDDSRTLAVVDVKYKPARCLPDRADINQVITYAVRYECDKAMVLYPDIPEGSGSVVSVGRVGEIRVYRGGLDLGTKDIALEEQRSASAILEELRRDLSPASSADA